MGVDESTFYLTGMHRAELTQFIKYYLMFAREMIKSFKDDKVPHGGFFLLNFKMSHKKDAENGKLSP